MERIATSPQDTSVETLRFLAPDEAHAVAKQWGTPTYVYDQATLIRQAEAALAFPAPYGLEVRYAMKANSHRFVLNTLAEQGISIDASSGFEAERAILAGIDPRKILLTSQELPKNLAELVQRGVEFNACSLHQFEAYGRLFPGTAVGVRINPGVGSGATKLVNVGDKTSSFGIWHEYMDDVLRIANTYGLTIHRLHTHIGSGADPDAWANAAQLSLRQAERLPDVTTVDLGGGFKISRMQTEHGTDLQLVGERVASALMDFYERTGRRLKLEIEPGTFLAANAGAIIARVQDMVDTGDGGYKFLKLDTGMTEILRPSLYGIRHPIVVVTDAPEQEHYVVVGHCCESGDTLTPSYAAPEDAEAVEPRLLHRASIDDLVVIEGAGAYCASVSAHHYNSFPRAAIIGRRALGQFVELSRRETLEDIVRLEQPSNPSHHSRTSIPTQPTHQQQ